MQQSIIERLNAIPMHDLFEKYNIPYVEGRNMKCPFPAHGATGATPSFRVYDDRTCACFGCHRGGGPIQFIENMEGCSFTEACDKLMGMYGFEKLPEFSYQTLVDKNKKKQEERDEQTKFNLLAELLGKIDLNCFESVQKFSFLYAMLPTCSSIQFLNLSVNALNESLEAFIEKVPEEIKSMQKQSIYLIKHLVPHGFELDRQFNRNECLSGFFNEQMSGVKWESQNNRYLFPIFLPGKFIVGFSGRALGNEFVKYQTELMFGLTKKDLMYGLDVAAKFIKEAGYVIVVEGILDVVRCRSVGFYNVVAPCPAYVTDNVAILLKSLTNRFLLFQDNDTGGDAESEMSLKVLTRHGCEFIRKSVPYGEDPDSYGKKCPQKLAELLKNPWI